MIHCFSGIGQRFIDNIAFLWILQFFQNQAVFLWNQTMFPRRNATFSRSMLTWHCISRRNILQSMLMAFIFADKLLAQHADMPLLFPEKLFMEHADEHLPSQRIPFMEDAVAALNSWTICFVEHDGVATIYTKNVSWRTLTWHCFVQRTRFSWIHIAIWQNHRSFSQGWCHQLRLMKLNSVFTRMALAIVLRGKWSPFRRISKISRGKWCRFCENFKISCEKLVTLHKSH